MKRRTFITLLGGAAAAWPLAARAQQPGRVPRIGVLMALAEDDPEAKARLAAFRQGLEKRGWSEARNVRIDYRFAPASAQAQVLAKELVALQPDVILAHSTSVTAALQRESRTIPIVFAAVADPIGSGFVASLPRPGGNITGVMQYEASVTSKWLAMLKEIAPSLVRAALVANPKTATYYDYYYRRLKPRRRHLGSSLCSPSSRTPPIVLEHGSRAGSARPRFRTIAWLDRKDVERGVGAMSREGCRAFGTCGIVDSA